MVTRWMVPSAAALTASRPSRAPVGTTIRAPVSLARSTRSIRGSSAPTLVGMKIPPLFDGGQGDLFEDGGRRAFEHEVGAGREVHQRNDGRGRAETRLPRPGARLVPRRDRSERQAFDARVDGGGDLPADRAETAYAYPERHASAAFPALAAGASLAHRPARLNEGAHA